MTPAPPHRVLLLPGWQNSGPAHWQSRWEAAHAFERVDQADWHWPRRGDWMAQLEERFIAHEAPTWLVAHSLGCHLVAAWARHSQQAQRVRGALLVAPPDTARDDTPAPLLPWRDLARTPLPFAATVVFSSNDPFGSAAFARDLAQAWGATPVPMGPRGHLNADSALGDWPEGLALLRNLGWTPNP